MLCPVMDMQLDVRRLIEMLRPHAETVPGLQDLAETARQEWEAAQIQFNEVREDELIDHAIFRLQAAERHYVYILRQAGRTPARSSEGASSVQSAGG